MTENEKQADRKRWIALYVLCAGMLMIVLDVTVVNVALPSIQDDLGFSQSSLAWVVNAYLITFGGLLLLAGRFGDLIGRKNVFMAGSGAVHVASLACGAAQSQEMLVAGRFVQGIGGAMTSAVILGMIVTMFPEPREQAKAIGVYAFVASAGGTIGLLAGGVLTQAISWHWIFFINVPIAIATAFLATTADRARPGHRPRRGRRHARRGADHHLADARRVHDRQARGRSGLEPIRRRSVSEPSPLALLVAFVVREAKAANPLMPLRIFRSRNVSGANVVQALLVAGMFGTVLPRRRCTCSEVLGYDPLEIGLAFLPATLIMATLSVRYAEPLIMRFGARRSLISGMVLVAASLALFAQAGVGGSYVSDVLPVMILLGFGIGVSFPALMSLAMSGATESDAGLASGLVNTSAQVGGAIGLAVLATLSTTRTDEPARRRPGAGGRADRRLSPRLLDRRGAGRRRHRRRGDGAAARAGSQGRDVGGRS